MITRRKSPPDKNAKGGKFARARAHFRKQAERLNPSPFVQIFDGRGRPRRKPRHAPLKV